RFDLPQPFGPTMPVRPESMMSSVGSTKDLKPLSLNFANCISAEPAFDFVEERRGRGRCRRRRGGRFGGLRDRGRGAGERGMARVVYLLDEIVIGQCADDFLAVDEEGRRRFDAEFRLRLVFLGDDL